MTKNIEPTIVFDGPEYIIIDKPALLDSQSSRPDRPSVADWLLEKYKFAGLVHRLDFGTSGLMVCAKNSNQARNLTEALTKSRIKREYLALVLGKITSDSGTIDSKLDDKPAITHFTVRTRFANATLLEVSLGTGRKHQIRRHFADFGYPILGDHLYGKRGAKLLFHRPALHAFRLTIEGHAFESEIPNDFSELLRKLQKGSRY